MHEAYKKRELEAIKKRLENHTRFEVFKKKIKINKTLGIPQAFIIYPVIDTTDNLKDIVNRISFFLPNNISIHIIVTNQLLNVNINDLSTPKYQNRYIGSHRNIFLINELDANIHIKNNNILIHDISALKKYSILKYSYKLEIIDKNFFSTVESEVFRHLYYSTLSNVEKENYLNISKINYSSLLQKYSSKEIAYCFTTGPSFEKYQDFSFSENSLKIICNSIVKNNEFITYIKGPDIIVFADPVFHFGPSEYAGEFRKNILDVSRKYNSYILVPDYTVPLLLMHYPELSKNLIGMPIINQDFNFPTEKEFFVKASENILTLLMLPVASTIAKTIYILGADGRKDNEKYFWEHSSSVQYNDKMESVYYTHPSFFRDRDYNDYYKQHCLFLSQQICYGEKYGRKYFTLTFSYIPALKSRHIRNPFFLIIFKNNFLCSKQKFITLLRKVKHFVKRKIDSQIR